MSLINDMLKDLEARKAGQGQPASEEAGRPREEPPARRVDELRHARVQARVEETARRRLGWLFWPFLLVLLLIAGALYVFRTGGSGADSIETRLPSTSQETAGSGPREPDGVVVEEATPAPLETSAPAMPVESAVETPVAPSLVMLATEASEGALRLELVFDAPLFAPIRLNRAGDRLELLLPGVQAGSQESPHPDLRDWLSTASGRDWKLGFNWPEAGKVRLKPGAGEEGLRHWQLTLLAPPANVALANNAVRNGVGSQSDTRRVESMDGFHSSPVAENPVSAASSLPPSVPILQHERVKPVQPPASRPPARPSLTPQQQAEALYAEAWEWQQKDRASLAQEKLIQALQVQPDHARARELLARLLLRAGAVHEAELELVRGLEIQPDQPDLVELYARLLADQGRTGEALGLLRQRMRQDVVPHHALHAVLAGRLGEQAEAARAYGRAAELAPRDPRWPLGQAIALENSAQPGAAREAYARALALDGLDAASRSFAQQRHALLDGVAEQGHRTGADGINHAERGGR
ncbi:MAG: tetratricopeptide repeat protein [Pseudomonadota bacterium]